MERREAVVALLVKRRQLALYLENWVCCNSSFARALA
jgi:hypothetical protein